MRTVPMRAAEREVIGVVQLINKRREPERPLVGDEDGVAFHQRSEELALAWGAMARIRRAAPRLYEEIRVMFDGFVEASVTAIESRDPTTSGHSRRGATMSGGVAKKGDGVADGPLAEVHFTATHLQQLEYAGVLHDFGKVGVRERVLVKAKK